MDHLHSGHRGVGVTVEVGKTYTDGWGVDHAIAGETALNPDWVFSIQGSWFRKTDGRYIAFVLIDKSKTDGGRRHVAAERPSKWDLVLT